MKHAPFTSEVSDPHTSKDCPELHVDILHFGEDGKKDNDLTVAHVTDPAMVDFGQKQKEFREEQKKD